LNTTTDFTTFTDGSDPGAQFTVSSNLLNAAHPGGNAWTFGFYTQDNVAVPNETTAAIELIIDIWSIQSFFLCGFIHDTGAWSNNTATGVGWALGLNTGRPNGVGNPNIEDVYVYRNGGRSYPAGMDMDDTLTFPFRIRLSSSGAPGSGYDVSVRALEQEGGVTTGFAPGSAWSTPFHDDVDIDTSTAPWAVGFSPYYGNYQIGMIEVYDTVGNDGSLAIDPSGPFNIPGDCNQDGEFDLSDVICLLNFMFLNTPPALPCNSAPGNLALVDCNGDGSIDISDAVYKLNSLFQGGPRQSRGRVVSRSSIVRRIRGALRPREDGSCGLLSAVAPFCFQLTTEDEGEPDMSFVHPCTDRLGLTVVLWLAGVARTTPWVVPG
jgi:hypothetical protein